MKICFIGDISLNNCYIDFRNNKIDPFLKVKSFLDGNFIVGNLECLSRGNEGYNINKMPRLYTQKNTLNLLNKLNLSVALLAHNHVYDNLKDGFIETTTFLKSNHIKYVGAGLNKEEALKPIILSYNNINVALINYVHIDTNPRLPINCPVYLNLYEKKIIIEQISNLKPTVNHIVLLLHWGGKHEEGYYPDNYQLYDSKEFIDAGADLIVGGHSHTLQPYYQYNGKYIIYSLGNFCFDDIVCNGKVFPIGKKRKRESAILCVNFFENKYSIVFNYIKNKSGFIFPANKNIARQHNRRNNFFKIYRKYSFIRRIYKFYFKYFTPIYIYLFEYNENLSKKIKKLNFKKFIKHFSK